jgi:type II secretion system protein I
MTGRRGLTLLEVMVAVAVLATGVVAVQRLANRSVATVARDGDLTRAMLLARSLLAEAELAPPGVGHVAGEAAPGFRFVRDVTRTPHARLREVRLRVFPAGRAAEGAELVELLRVPAP